MCVLLVCPACVSCRGTEPLELADFQSDFDAVPEAGEWGCLHPGERHAEVAWWGGVKGQDGGRQLKHVSC